jgi:hypothetical protein
MAPLSRWRRSSPPSSRPVAPCASVASPALMPPSARAAPPRGGACLLVTRSASCTLRSLHPRGGRRRFRAVPLPARWRLSRPRLLTSRPRGPPARSARLVRRSSAFCSCFLVFTSLGGRARLCLSSGTIPLLALEFFLQIRQICCWKTTTLPNYDCTRTISAKY